MNTYETYKQKYNNLMEKFPYALQEEIDKQVTNEVMDLHFDYKEGQEIIVTEWEQFNETIQNIISREQEKDFHLLMKYWIKKFSRSFEKEFVKELVDYIEKELV